MGGVIARLSKPIRTFNIEHRAQKVINKKPVVAPSYESVEKLKKAANEINPNFMKEHYVKDSILNARLREVYVSSHMKEAVSEDFPEKPMPQNRRHERDFDYGFWEPNEIPKGNARFRDILQLMSDNMNDSEKYNAENLALKYQLNQNDVENILEYYRVFQVVVPKKQSFDGIKVADPPIRATIRDK
ncbi:hypothetical protein HCN44_001661 [Aphidius gifuensis]|uniref:Uncharacterized protein n=1 Tax=Aphidius gifuensis TaxID=684658 RepID=A0A834XT50_APHGI|nr:protein NDUFAF4 homolog [Aphidius gifuensis]KAF7992336.1 hypothetical protein HCN44_001661 [Aphidius gifuensis]